MGGGVWGVVVCVSYYLHGHLVSPGAGGEQLLGDGLPLCEAAAAQDGLAAVLVDHHDGPGVHVGPVQHRLTQLLHVPRRDRLRVRQLGGKHLANRSTSRRTGWLRTGVLARDVS